MIKRLTLAIAMLALLNGCSTTLLPPNITPDVPLTNSVEQADRKLEEARIERAAVEARFSAAEQVCYARFFVNDCLDDAKEKRRSALAYLRAVEVEAEYFQRKSRADERDREMAEAQKAFDAEEARRAAEPAAPPRAPVAEAPAPAARKAALTSRKAQAEQRQAAAAAREREEAPQRAANVAAFEKKQADAAARQRSVAEKLAKRQADSQARAKAAPAPAPAPAPK